MSENYNLSESGCVIPDERSWSCRDCICRKCLMWWSGRCPYGTCYDDHRAVNYPWDKAHPNEPLRTEWSEWRTQQQWWCRGGTTYPAKHCEHYVEYEDSKVHSCFGAAVEVFQDGFMRCGYGENPDCTRCFEQHQKREAERDVPHN